MQNQTIKKNFIKGIKNELEVDTSKIELKVKLINDLVFKRYWVKQPYLKVDPSKVDPELFNKNVDQWVELIKDWNMPCKVCIYHSSGYQGTLGNDEQWFHGNQDVIQKVMKESKCFSCECPYINETYS